LKIFETHPKLEHIHFSQGYRNNESFHITSNLKQGEELQASIEVNIGMDTYHLRELLKAISNLHFVTFIKIKLPNNSEGFINSENTIPQAIQYLIKMFETTTSLVEVDLSDKTLDKKNLITLAESLKAHKSVTHIKLLSFFETDQEIIEILKDKNLIFLTDSKSVHSEV
jgi:hypothetical protein